MYDLAMSARSNAAVLPYRDAYSAYFSRLRLPDLRLPFVLGVLLQVKGAAVIASQEHRIETKIYRSENFQSAIISLFFSASSLL